MALQVVPTNSIRDLAITSPKLAANPLINGQLSIGSTNERVRNTANNSATLSLESADGYAYLSSRLGTPVTANAYSDGANWQRFDVSQPTLFAVVWPTYFAVWTSAAAANPIVAPASNFMVAANSPGSVGAKVTIGPTNEYIRNPVAAANNLSIESVDGNVFVCGGSQAFLTYNAYWDGSGWQRFAVGNAASYHYVSSGGLAFGTAPSGANPISGFTNRFTVDPLGNGVFNGSLTADGGSRVWSAALGPLARMVGSCAIAPTWSSSAPGTWVATPVTVTGTIVSTSTAVVFIWVYPIFYTNSGVPLGVYVAIAIDGAVQAYAYHLLVNNGSPQTLPFAFAANCSPGSHTFTVYVNFGAGTINTWTGAHSTMIVQEMRTP